MRRPGPGVPVRPVVKADAYGHGAVPVARALVEAGADGLCVATFDEALALRAARIRAPLLVLYPIPPVWAPDAARRGIGVSAGDPDLLAATLAAFGSARRPGSRRLRIELEVETGLGRGGFWPEAVVAAAQAVRAGGAVVAGLWTHLQAPEDRERTDGQLRRFEAAAAALRAAGIRLPARHATASAGLLAQADGLAAYDGVRPGLAIYGLVPDELRADRRGIVLSSPPRPVMSLHARPVRVADVPAGWGIGYGPTFETDRPSRIATLPLGYGDGWSRSLSNRANALVRGQRVPLVGNVAMDAVMADVTDVPGSAGHVIGCLHPHRAPGRPVDHGRGVGAGAHHELRGRSSRPWLGGYPGCTMPDPDPWVFARSPSGVDLARIELWNGDICDLEVDAIVNAANLSLWMSTGVGGAIKRAGGDAIEFAAVRQAPVPLGEAGRHDRRRPGRPSRHPRRVARSRAAHQRTGHRGRRPLGDGPSPGHPRDQHRLPGARHGRRRLPARRGGPDHRPDGARRVALVS